jgi:hypothetical protein
VTSVDCRYAGGQDPGLMLRSFPMPSSSQAR